MSSWLSRQQAWRSCETSHSDGMTRCRRWAIVLHADADVAAPTCAEHTSAWRVLRVRQGVDGWSACLAPEGAGPVDDPLRAMGELPAPTLCE
jgi:hypothetical protein